MPEAAPLRVLLVTQYFPPEVGAPQARLSEMAQCWAESGLDVTVLTGMPNYPTGVVPPEYRGAVLRREQRDGYQVVRSWLYATPNEGVLRKTASHLSFMVSAAVLGLRAVRAADVVVVSSGPFFQIGAAWLIAKARRARFVVEVRDLWPAIFVQLGVLTDRRIIALLERLELAAYRAADAVVTVTEGFRHDIAGRGIPADKIEVIPNGVDTEFFHPTAPDPEIRRRLGAADGDTLVLYLGTHGISQGLTSVVEAAAELVDQHVHVAFVGEGADKQRVAAEVSRLGLRNVTMLGNVPRADVPEIVAAADICVVPLRAIPLFATFVPSKMYELLAAGKAVVGALEGEAADILNEAGATVVPPEAPLALAAAIRKLAGDPEARMAAGAAGRAYVIRHHDRRVLATKYQRLLETLSKAPRR